MFEQGLIPEPETALFEHVYRDISQLFDKSKAVINKLAKNNKTDLVESLKNSIDFMDSVKKLAENMKPKTLWGKELKRFVNDMKEQVQFILRQNINIAKGQSFVDFTKNDLMSIIDQAKKEAIVTVKNMKNDKANMISNLSEIIELFRNFLTGTNNLKPNNKISEYFMEGVNLSMRKLMAGNTYFLKSVQNE